MGANCRVAKLFSEIASLLEIADDNVFKIRAYRRAADLIGALPTGLDEMSAGEVAAVKGIGREMSAKIAEFLETGEMEYHGRLLSELGGAALEMLSLRGTGPKTVRLFLNAGITSIDELEKRLAEPGSVKGVGEKKALAVLDAISFYKSNVSVHRLDKAFAAASALRAGLSAMEGASEVCAAGGLRRMTETVSEIEMLVSFGSGARIDRRLFLKNLSLLPIVKNVTEDGADKDAVKALVETSLTPIKTFVYGSPPASFAFNLARLTGSPAHWEKLCSVSGGPPSAGRGGEESIYSSSGLAFIPPELREDTGEIEAAKSGNLPRLVEAADIRGDLHTHTDWSDGRDTVRAMAGAAREMGYQYIALTDHSPSSVVANGLDAGRLALKTEEVRAANSETGDLEILMGAEVDIKPDGSLDYPDDILRELDFVVASVHGSFSQSSGEMTKRIIRALENPFVHALGHPTARIIGRRPPCEMDIAMIADAALQNGKALEINASGHRLDLKDTHARLAVEKGVKLIISTDAHGIGQLGDMGYGVAVGRRGWARAADVLNTLALPDLLRWLRTRG